MAHISKTILEVMNNIKDQNFYNFVRDYHPKQINSNKLTPSGNKGVIAILDG